MRVLLAAIFFTFAEVSIQVAHERLLRMSPCVVRFIKLYPRVLPLCLLLPRPISRLGLLPQQQGPIGRAALLSPISVSVIDILRGPWVGALLFKISSRVAMDRNEARRASLADILLYL